MFGFITDVFSTLWTHDLPAIRNWIVYGKLQPVVALPGPVDNEPLIDEALPSEASVSIYEDEPEAFDEVDSEETYKEQPTMGDWLNRSSRERKYINDLFRLHGIKATVSNRIAGGHTFYGFAIDTEDKHTNSIEKWSNVERIVPEIEAILHKRRLEGGAIDEGIERGTIRQDYRTVVRVTDQPQMMEVSRIDVRDLIFDIDEYEGDPHTAFAGIGYANGRAINIVWDLEDPDTAHLMIAGRTGSGKSVLLACVVATLAHATPVEELNLYLVDGKNEDLAPFASLPHARSFSHEPEDNIRVIQHVASIVDDRNDNEDRKRVVLVIDELADVVATGDTDAAITALTKIAQKGRSKNVTLIGCTQKPQAANMGGDVKSNIPLKYIGAVGSPEDAKLVSGLKQTGAEKLPGRGSFLCVGGGGITRFQAPFIEDVDLAVEVVCNTWGYEIAEEPEEVDATADITMQKIHTVLDGYFNDIGDDGAPIMRRGWKTAAIKVLNDGVDLPRGRRWQELSKEADAWFQQWFQHGSAMVPAGRNNGSTSGDGTNTGTIAEPLNNQRGTMRNKRWITNAPLAVKPVFVNRSTKH